MKKQKYTKDWSANKGVVKEEDKKKRSSLAWAFFIAAIMIASTIGYMWIGGSEADLDYNGHKIARTDNGFAYTKDKNTFDFSYFPSELEDIKGNTTLIIADKPMFYLTFDPESDIVESIDLMRFEFSDELPKLNVYFQQGVLKQSSIYNFTIIDCANATANAPVVKFIESNETKITEDASCLIFEAKNNYDVIKLKDLMLYSLLGVM
jgi:hypothetical protein